MLITNKVYVNVDGTKVVLPSYELCLHEKSVWAIDEHISKGFDIVEYVADEKSIEVRGSELSVKYCKKHNDKNHDCYFRLRFDLISDEKEDDFPAYFTKEEVLNEAIRMQGRLAKYLEKNLAEGLAKLDGFLEKIKEFERNMNNE